MSNHSVDEEIEALFAKTTTTREACHEFARGLGGAVVSVTIQGVCSYTVYGGPQSEKVVQFRIKSLALSLETASFAREIYGEFVPNVEYRGQLGDDDAQPDNAEPRKEPLMIYVMDRIAGTTYLEFILAHSGDIPLSLSQFAQFRLKLSKAVAKDKKDAMLQKQKKKLEMLRASLPERFQPFVQQSLEALPDIFTLLPAALAHKDFSECNVIVNETTGDLVA